MSVRKRKWRDQEGRVQERWMVHIEFTHPDGRRQRVRKVSPVQTRRGAQRYERELREALLAGAYGKEQPELAPIFADFADEFVDNYAKVNNKYSSVESKRSILANHLIPFFGRMRLDQIGPRDIERFKASKLATHARKTINNHLTVLRRLLVVAQEWGVLDQVPPIRWLKAPKPDFRFLDFEEAERLLTGAKREPPWWTMILLALNTGLRQGELLALRWDDIDLVRGRLMVRRAGARGVVDTPKNGRTREIPLNDRTIAGLKAHRHLRGPLVFCNDDGSMLTKNRCKWPLRRAQRKAGITALGWHDMRHTFASHLVMRGISLKAVQELLGHATIEMTMRYAHLTPCVLRDAVEQLGPQPEGTTGAHEGPEHVKRGARRS